MFDLLLNKKSGEAPFGLLAAVFVFPRRERIFAEQNAFFEVFAGDLDDAIVVPVIGDNCAAFRHSLLEIFERHRVASNMDRIDGVVFLPPRDAIPPEANDAEEGHNATPEPWILSRTHAIRSFFKNIHAVDRRDF